MPPKIAARKSDLARLQAYRVGEALRGHAPNLTPEYLFSTSLGDQNQEDPLWQMPEKGVFTEDLTKKLIEGESDMVVHSWKDLPTEERKKTAIVATLPREDARDVILFRKASIVQRTGRMYVLSSSPRRALSVREFLEWALPFPATVEFKDVRGNILTRVKKLMNLEADALVVAKAALDRLLLSHEDEFAETRTELRAALSQCLFMVVPLSENPGAAAQGALAIEVNNSSAQYRGVLAGINCRKTFENVTWERQQLATYGGGCHQKIGITRISRHYGDVIFQRGLTDDGRRIDGHALVPVAAPKKKLLERLLKVPVSKLFPVSAEDVNFFERQPLTFDSSTTEGRNLWVAKSDALPALCKVALTQVVWVAGNQTWRKLAERGVWVSGSQDSLGEDDVEMSNIEGLLGRRPQYLKLSHVDALEIAGRSENSYVAEVLPTYKLIEKTTAPNLKDKTHFYWLSASMFLSAFRRFPELREAKHACGPGHTYKFIRETLGPDAEIEIFLSHSGWLQAYLKP